jgi:hypothetical protein
MRPVNLREIHLSLPEGRGESRSRDAVSGISLPHVKSGATGRRPGAAPRLAQSPVTSTLIP